MDSYNLEKLLNDVNYDQLLLSVVYALKSYGFCLSRDVGRRLTMRELKGLHGSLSTYFLVTQHECTIFCFLGRQF